MKQEKLLKRFRYLWTGELFASLFLPTVLIGAELLIERGIGIFTLYAILCVNLILWQGVIYWRLKQKAVRLDRPVEAKRLAPFLTWKKINWGMLALLPVVLTGRFYLAGKWQFNLDFTYGAMMYILAVLEQINYYYVQLMYDYPEDWQKLLRTKQLKKASLRRALENMTAEQASGLTISAPSPSK